MPNDHRSIKSVKTIEVANAEFLPHVVALVNEGHTVTLPLRGNSMRPFLENGRDAALLSQARLIETGDVVLAEIRPGTYVLHRVVSIAGSAITLRGDGNLATECCRVEDVRAKAIAFYRKGRHEADTVSGLKWRLYSALWTRLLPVRRYLLFIYRHLPIKL